MMTERDVERMLETAAESSGMPGWNDRLQWLVDATLAATSKGVELLEEELGCVAAGKGTPAPDEEKTKNQTNPYQV